MVSANDLNFSPICDLSESRLYIASCPAKPGKYILYIYFSPDLFHKVD